MRSILEKAIVHLLNEEQEQAEALFHKFMVERAREIHESLRQGEEVVLAEGWDDEITSEEYFAEDDLDAVVDADAEHADHGEHEAAAAVVADDLADDETADVEPADGIEDRVDDIEDQIEKLTAEFETMMAELDDDDAATDDEIVDAEDGHEEHEMADQMEADVADDEPAEGEHEMADHDMAEGDEMEDDDLSDITESVLSELEQISTKLNDGSGVGAGGTPFMPNTRSPYAEPPKNGRRPDAMPVQMRSSYVKDYSLENAPTVNVLKTRKNTRKHASDFVSEVKPDKNAVIMNDFAKVKKGDFTVEKGSNAKSMIDGKSK